MMRRNSMLLSAAALLLAVGGCYSARWKPTESEPLHTVMQSSKGQQISGYIDAEGTYHKFEGTVRLLGDDSLEFQHPAEPAQGLTREHPAVRMALHRSQVKTLSVMRISPGKTFVAVIGITVLAVAVL